MPIMKLHVHEAKLPIDMATERGATSNSSAKWRVQIESVRALKINETRVRLGTYLVAVIKCVLGSH